jgi:hypothetical protein
MKYKLLFWSVFILNLVIAILLVKNLKFKSAGESTGFMVSIIFLYLIPYGIIILFTHFNLKSIKRNEFNQLSNLGKKLLNLKLYFIPVLAFYSVLHILIFVVPQAVIKSEYMNLNGISMALGFLFGGLRSIYKIRNFKLA